MFCAVKPTPLFLSHAKTIPQFHTRNGPYAQKSRAQIRFQFVKHRLSQTHSHAITKHFHHTPITSSFPFGRGKKFRDIT